MADTLHRQGHLSVLRAQFSRDGKVASRTSIRHGTKSGFSSQLTHLSSTLISFFGCTMGMTEAPSHHKVLKIKSDKVRQVSSIMPSMSQQAESAEW